MQTERALLLLVVLIAVAGGAFYFLGASTQAESEAQRAQRAAETADEAAGGGAGGAGQDDTGDARAGSLDAAFRRRLEALGFGADLEVPDDQAVIIGRVLGRSPAPEGSTSLDDVPFEPVANAEVAVHRVGDDGVAEERPETTGRTRSRVSPAARTSSRSRRR
jgi:hypothetical protein